MTINPVDQPASIGDHKIIRRLGKGGMGEVFLALDPVCRRQVALKRIRPEMTHNLALRQRFLKEARIASQLSHPSIIPIYTIHEAAGEIFYTMPYVEGETLKQILRTAIQQEKDGEITHPIGSSIPTLMRLFLSVCQAIAYSHARKILHRDLKPDNIMVGKYGEVLILDWGLADLIPSPSAVLPPKKIPGTLTYLAPERLLGAPSSEATDIYALGVILYQLLTLHLPFQRLSVESVRKRLHLERLIDPQELSPYREIPPHLSDIAKRALQSDPSTRFPTINELIAEIESYIAGRPEWLPAAHLDPGRSEDWEFQENILLAKHLAITRLPSVMEWVSIMISKQSFSGNTRIRAQILLKDVGNGIGFLLNIPEASERQGPEDGYCLWIGSQAKPGCKLFRSNVEVMHLPEVFLSPLQQHRICIEKVDCHLRFYLDGILQFHYVSYIPVNGTHVGLLYRDGDFEMPGLQVDMGSQNVMVNCLAIPDAFLANKNYTKALSEYRRIGYAFSGRAEGREALFRAGITLLEEARGMKKRARKQRYALALDEFGHLRHTPGAPLEYLGKALVYQAAGDTEEEIKCLELCVRKYARHPLLKVVGEHIKLRLHETSLISRFAAYQFALISIRHLPHIFQSEDSQHLLTHLVQHLEPLSFILSPYTHSQLAVQLSFWLARPMALIELIEHGLAPLLHADALYALLYLGEWEWVADHIESLDHEEEKACIRCILSANHKKVDLAIEQFNALPDSASQRRCAEYLLRMPSGWKYLHHFPHLQTRSLLIDAEILYLYLYHQSWKKAQKLLEGYSIEQLIDEKSPLYPLVGCWLWHQEGPSIAMTHFSGVAENSHPPTTALLGTFLAKHQKGWQTPVFYWEKVEFLRQLTLFYHCTKQPKGGKWHLTFLKKEIKTHERLHR